MPVKELSRRILRSSMHEVLKRRRKLSGRYIIKVMACDLKTRILVKF
jgi:hypothetical protein